MTQHTPGPWWVESDRDAGHSNHQRHHIYSIMSPEGRLAVCSYKKNEENNSRLIAAAPDVVDALRPFLMLGFQLSEVEKRVDPGTYECIKAGRAAIAKATGEV